MLTLPPPGLSRKQRRHLLAALKAERARRSTEAGRYDWRATARTAQVAPPGDWSIWLILAGRGFGKALALDTPIPTPSGWTTMGALSVDDTVFDQSGAPCRVTFATPVQLDRRCYRVVFSDGEEIVADAEHLWVTRTHAERKAIRRRVEVVGPNLPPQCQPRHAGFGIRTTEAIRQTLAFGSRADRNHSVDVAGALQLPAAELPIDPYIFGAWLGDGSSACADITVGDDDFDALAAEVASAGYQLAAPRRKDGARCGTYGISNGSVPARCAETGRMQANGSLTSLLNDLGARKNKHIPLAYLRAAEEQRLALLQGLMDTDGTIGANGFCEFSVTNERLAADFYELAVSLGMRAGRGTKQARVNGKDCGTAWRVWFRPTRQVFRLARKAERVRLDRRQASRSRHRMIVAIEPVATVPVRCITVDSPSRTYLAGRGMVPTHNTRSGAEFIREEVEAGRATRIALIARTAADTRDVMVEGKSGILNVFPPDKRPVYEPSKRRVTFHNGAIATLFSADEPNLLRGPEHDLAWCDELASWRYMDAWSNMRFGLRIGKHPRVVVTTTPKPQRLLAELMKNPRTVITRGSTWENAANLAEDFLSDLEPYKGTTIGRQELDGELLDMGQHAIIKPIWWKHWTEKRPQCEVIVQCWDTAYEEHNKADFSACTTWGIFRKQGDQKEDWEEPYNLILLGAWRGRPGFPELRELAKDMQKRWEPNFVLIERKASGTSLIQEFQRAKIPVRSFRPGAESKRSRAWSISHLFERGRIWAPATKREDGATDKLFSWAQPVVDECGFFHLMEPTTRRKRQVEEEAQHDDYVDTVVMAARFLRDQGWLQHPDEDEDERAAVNAALYKRAMPRAPAYG